MSKVTIFGKNADFLQKNTDNREIKRALVLKGIFSETTYVLGLQTRCCFLIPLKNIKRFLGFLMFSGGIEKQHLAVMGYFLHFEPQKVNVCLVRRVFKTLLNI